MLAHEIARADAILSDQLVELRNINDPEWDDPAQWGPEWDSDRWELGPERAPVEPDPDEEPATYEPSEEDRADQARWAERWEEYRAWSEWADRLDAMRRTEDADFERQQRWGRS
jgi:hypothetical protein